MLEDLYKILPTNLEYDTILHSDQGWQYQYQHKQYRYSLQQHNIIQSMSRKENCLDNSIAKRFFGKLKNEFYYDENFISIDDFILKLKDYIEYYNKIRIKAALHCSPFDYRMPNAA